MCWVKYSSLDSANIIGTNCNTPTMLLLSANTSKHDRSHGCGGETICVEVLNLVSAITIVAVQVF